MSAKKSRKEGRKKLLFFLGALIVLCIFGLGFVGLQKFLVTQKLKQPLSCENPQGIKYFVNHTWNNPKVLNHENVPTWLDNSVGAIYVQPDKSFPNLEFKDKILLRFGTKASLASIQSYTTNILIPKILQSGYEISPDVTGIGGYQTAYKSGNTFIHVDSSQFAGPNGGKPEGTILDIECGQIDPTILNRYKEMLGIPAIQEELKLYQKPSNIRFEIWGDYGDFVYLDIGYISGGAGAVWVHKNADGSWSKIFEGSIPPWCDIMENLHAPSGITCEDRNNNYIDRKTK